MTDARIDEIKIGTRFRRDLGDVSSLAESVAEIGLLQPIVVSPDGQLVAGARRIEAFKQLGRTTDKHPRKLPTSCNGRALDKAVRGTGRARRTIKGQSHRRGCQRRSGKIRQARIRYGSNGARRWDLHALKDSAAGRGYSFRGAVPARARPVPRYSRRPAMALRNSQRRSVASGEDSVPSNVDCRDMRSRRSLAGARRLCALAMNYELSHAPSLRCARRVGV
jgi:hypothetical protein